MPVRRAYKATPYGQRYARPAQRSYATAQAGGRRSAPAAYGTVGEMKYYDTERAAVAIASSSTFAGCEVDPNVSTRQGITNINCLFAPPNGTTIDARGGNKCWVYKIKVRGAVRVPPQTTVASPDDACRVRILLVWDKQTNATQLNSEDVINNPSTNTPVMSVNAFQNINHIGRFQVLKDKIITLQNPAASNGDDQNGLLRPFKMMINFKKPIQVRFDQGGAGTVADVIDNSFHVLANTDNAELVPEIAYYSRVCFKDV